MAIAYQSAVLLRYSLCDSAHVAFHRHFLAQHNGYQSCQLVVTTRATKTVLGCIHDKGRGLDDAIYQSSAVLLHIRRLMDSWILVTPHIVSTVQSHMSLSHYHLWLGLQFLTSIGNGCKFFAKELSLTPSPPSIIAQMLHSVLHQGEKEPRTLKYIVTHVFLPLRLPDGDDYSLHNDHALAGAVAFAARLYLDHLVDTEVLPQWHSIIGLLDNLHTTVQFESLDRLRIISQLSSMVVGDVRAFFIRAQNVAIIFRKQKDATIYESFEVSPKTHDVMISRGKLICSYPGPAIEIPTTVFEDEGFLSELANFLVHMNDDILDAAPTTTKAQSTVLETRNTTHPRYITELLTGILRSVGRPAETVRISKRIGDDVVWNNSRLPWRRSSLWLIIRVALQTSLDQPTSEPHIYKTFMLYFMCCLAQAKACAEFPNDLICAISTKISHRLRKMGTSAPDWLSKNVLETCASLRSILEDRWRHVQDTQHLSPLWTPSQLDLTQDVQLSLLNSGTHLRSSLANQNSSPSKIEFQPKYRPRGTLYDFLSSNAAFFKEAYRAEPHATLYDVERAVEQGIDAWVDRVTEIDEACEALELLANSYSSGALVAYKNNPELMSVMFLTVVELWVALDKIAVRDIPMLADYSPEVPIDLLEGLLCCRKTSLRRLRRAYQYISLRYSSAKSGWSVFAPTLTKDSFSVRFYRGSLHLQRLKDQIEKTAQEKVRLKFAELEEANARHAELQRKSDLIIHEYIVDEFRCRIHVEGCAKCYYERKLGSMKINVYEWPLPARQFHAEAVVFELDCSISFDMWRSATTHLLVDLCSPSIKPTAPYMQLSQYAALGSYFDQHSRSRVSLASNTKPVVSTHYNKVPIPATQEQVQVNNGASFYGFDTRAKIPVSQLQDHVDISKCCTYQLDIGPYQTLQKYVSGTSHTSNEIMANQADCPRDLLIHEFIAFGHLRSGSLLQWSNVLRELRGRSLSFHRHEVHLLLAQAVCQVGPLEQAEWTWHQEIQQPSFCYALLEELEKLLHDIEANWLESVTMDTISLLLRRLLASSPNQAVSQKALGLLRTARSKVFSWIQELSDKLVNSPVNEEFRGYLRDAAAVCRSTFDVDPIFIPNLLHSAEDMKILLSSAVLIHHHTPLNVSSLPTYSQLLLDRDRRLSLSLMSAISDVIQADSSDRGINLALSWIWPDYRPGSRWTTSQHTNSSWLSCRTAETANQSSQAVHFNMMDGSLLVNGKPIGRLPNAILRHALYKLILGKQVLEIMPGDLPGMDYSTRGKISDHQVYFSLNGKELVIQAIATGSSEVIELIPPGRFEGDLPAILIKGHVHWLNLSTSIIEIRPYDSLWKSSSDNWAIHFASERCHMLRGQEFFVDVRSKSWDMVSRLFKPLDIPQNLIVTASPTSLYGPLQLSVTLPRYGLSFYVNESGDLQSRNFRDMVYDKNQSIGTLFGLVNRLVLRPKLGDDVGAGGLIPRLVLIPEGEISYQKDDHHVRVEIDTRASTLQRPVKYQTYNIDTDLGCLAGNANRNKLLCAYLHALTSGCCNDPLTGRSGTEEALSLLRSASCWSITRFDSRDAELLRLIASLCPSRMWYPKTKKNMQKVDWLNLPVNSQHHGLYLVCKEIKEHYERLQLIREGQSNTFTNFPVHDIHLLERSAQRAPYQFPSALSRGPPMADLDVLYPTRDRIETTSGEHRAYTAATVVYHRRSNSTINEGFMLSLFKSWSKVSRNTNTALSLRYDRSWLAPDPPSIWFKAYNLLRCRGEEKWCQMLFSLPAMAYASQKFSDFIPVFVAFAMDAQFLAEDPPHYESYDLSLGYELPLATLRTYVSASALSFERSPESTKPAKSGESDRSLRQRRRKMYDDRRNRDIDRTVGYLSNAWPCEMPPWCSLNPRLYAVDQFYSKVERVFASNYRNLRLREHFIRIQEILNNVQFQTSPSRRYSFNPSQGSPCIPWSLTLDQLFTRPAPSLPARDKLPPSTTEVENVTPPSGCASLDDLIATAEVNAVNPFERQYISALRDSANGFGSEVSRGAQGAVRLPTTETLEAYYARCSASYTKGLELLKQHLGPGNESERALEQSGQWPRISSHTLFQSLASNSSTVLSDGWKACLTKLALLALELQRARRLLRLHLDNLREELRREIENRGCDGWNPEVHPDWLLIQLQGNILVRRVQAEVANQMIAPCSGSNTAMQLNMGEGKSSVIVPIVVVNLADGNQLVRVIVPKALTTQMIHLLVNRLGGLVNRRVYYIPFSRSIKADHQKVTALHEIMSDCMKERGILVVQPEHILSLRLVSVEKQLLRQKDAQLANLLLKLQKWLHLHSRDILDESDEILHVRYQLVYTIGLQQHMEGFPERWTTTQQVLGLVDKHAPSLRESFPLGVEYQRGTPGSFAHLRVLHVDAGQELISRIVKDVVDGLLPNFSFGQLRSGVRDAIRNFISCEQVHAEEVQLVKKYSQQTPMWGGLLLLRGLLATGILLYAFRERRWRVDYGLAPTRTMLAVPYRAKDVPAQRAEFGHPDVAIILTCLSYYYGGLNEDQLKLSFEILLKQEDPALDYDLWVRDCPDVPVHLQTLSGINIKSLEQWDKFIFPLLSRNRATVNFYLSSVVFPKEAKEFPSKLSCSGWDLAEKKERLLTGFSGTNDGQYLLPLHIIQRDPDHQRGTNAKVLSYLLQPENKHYVCMTHENGERRTTHEFLEMLVAQRPAIRVLLDVGAQMLDLQNYELAKAWLDINPDASAAIYFDEDDELTVRLRDGSTQLFLSSPFARQLDQCIVYLDDAHTRGTDITFPSGFRAAVTLGPRVTKDRLTQGCMRMRKLGLSHSVMFFAPLEVDRRIRSVAGKNDPSDVVNTTDILQWTIRETCEDIHRRVPHWAQQGMDHTSRYRAWTSLCKDDSQSSLTALSKQWLQPEAKKLEKLYGPRNTSNPFPLDVPDIRQRCVELGVLSFRNVGMDEEQEREVIHEAERERQVERHPPKVIPAGHSIHPDVVNFIKSGFIPIHTNVFLPAFTTLDTTGAASQEMHVWSREVLATEDFQRTVRLTGKTGPDQYLRPVQWVVSGKRFGESVLVILSPYEVNYLLPFIRSSNRIHLHVYTPRVSRTMAPCDDLALYSIPTVSAEWTSPSSLMDQLNVFAGQLYLKDYETYLRLCRFLCVYARDLEDEEDMEVACDGFISPVSRPMHLQAGVRAFQNSPLKSLRTLMNIRRKGMRIEPTHMGKLLNGRILLEDDFDVAAGAVIEVTAETGGD